MYKGIYKSPIGILEIIADEKSIIELSLVKNENELSQYGENEIIKSCKKELDEYFKGSRKIFECNLSFTGTDFQNRVWKELIKIPFGKSISYKELAKRIEKPTAIRAVANAVGKNKILILIPCHRIIGIDKSLTGFSAGIENKKYLLDMEEIEYV